MNKLINTPFNYTGSKFKLLNDILPNMDYSKSGFVDVFCGGGSVYTNILDRYDTVLVNDIISDLIGIHKALMESDSIIQTTKEACPNKDNKDEFLSLRESYNENNAPYKLWALMLSCTSNMMRFNKKFKFNQTFGKRTWNPKTEQKVKEFTEHIRKYSPKLIFSSKSFFNLNVMKDTMYYCDPPYSNTEAGYNAYWNKGDDEKLYEFCKKIDDIGSSFMVSGLLKHNGVSCLLLDKLISDGYHVNKLEYNYNKVSRVGNKKTEEITITNY